MKKTIKVIAAMMIMAITTTMPAMAGNKKYGRHDKNTKVVVVVNNNKVAHFDKRSVRFDTPKKHGYRPAVRTCTFRVNRHAANPRSTNVAMLVKHAVAKAERIHGVIDAYWNPRTREITVHYDARVTSARHIRHLVA